MKIVFAYNVKTKEPSLNVSEQDEQEYDSPEVIKLISDAMETLGHQVIPLEANLDAFEKLRQLKGKVDLVFIIAEGVRGDARESQIPLFCEMLGIPYTHSSPTTHAVRLDKHFAKFMVKGAGVNVPRSILIENGNVPDKVELNFPVIIKPNSEGSSIGIFNDNVVSDKEALDKRVEKLFNGGLAGSLIVEEYIEGREFTVSVIGNYPPTILPIVEQRFDFLPKGYNRIAGYELKWILEDKLKNLQEAYDCPAKLTDKQLKELKRITLVCYEVLRIKDCARLDFRLSLDDVFYFLEANTLPGMNFSTTEISYFPISAREAGMDVVKVIDSVIKNACRRYKID